MRTQAWPAKTEGGGEDSVPPASMSEHREQDRGTKTIGHKADGGPTAVCYQGQTTSKTLGLRTSRKPHGPPWWKEIVKITTSQKWKSLHDAAPHSRVLPRPKVVRG